MTKNKDWWKEVGKIGTQSEKDEGYTLDQEDSIDIAEKPKVERRKRSLRKLLILALVPLILFVPILLFQDILLNKTFSSAQDDPNVKGGVEFFSILNKFVGNGGNLNAFLTAESDQAIEASEPNEESSANDSELDGVTPHKSDEKPATSSASSGKIHSTMTISEDEEIANNNEDIPSNQISKFDDENLSVLMSNPDAYIGYDVSITGQISSIYDDNDSISYDKGSSVDFIQEISSLQMIKPRVYDTNSNVILQNPWIIRLNGMAMQSMENIQLATGNCLSVQGVVEGTTADTTTIKKENMIPVIRAHQLSNIQCIDSAMPALRTIELDLTKTIDDVILSIKRVQFAEDHTRVQIEATNKGVNDSTFIRARESFATQNEAAFENTSHLPKYIEYRIDPVLLPDIENSSYLFFEPINQDSGQLSFTIVVEKSTIIDDSKLNFVFDVN